MSVQLPAATRQLMELIFEEKMFTEVVEVSIPPHPVVAVACLAAGAERQS